MGYQDIALATSGVPSDKFYLDDFIKLQNWDQYKVIVFINAYHLNSTERAFIDRNLKNSNRTLIWHYASGYLAEHQMSTKNISDLVGMNIATHLSSARQRAIAVSSNNPLAKNLLPLQGMGDIFRTQFRLDTDEHTFDAQRFWIEDPVAETLAEYPEDHKSAIAVRRFANWTSLYVAPLGGISGELLNNAAVSAGAYVASVPNKLLVNMNDRFISLHALQSGEYQITLPQKFNVVDVDSGKVLFSDVGSFRVPLEAQQTEWLLLE